MPPAILRLLTLLIAALAGCAAPDPAPTEHEEKGLAAPWWEVGEYWDVLITRADGSEEPVRLVHFLNDSETQHFWLGTSDRNVAMDMALHSNNPLLGRIHWRILTPHESGIHATGMYTFPTEAGDTFGGLMFGHEWEITAEASRKPGGLLFSGASSDRFTIEYDYDPDLRWFSFVEVRDRNGAPEIRIQNTGHGTGATGSHWFLRGRDYYDGPESGGLGDEPFDVKTEEKAHKSLAVEFAGSATGPLTIEIVDPSGAVMHRETLLPGERVDRIVEIPAPALGGWNVRYSGTGQFEGRVLAVGILETTTSL